MREKGVGGDQLFIFLSPLFTHSFSLKRRDLLRGINGAEDFWQCRRRRKWGGKKRKVHLFERAKGTFHFGGDLRSLLSPSIVLPLPSFSR